MESAKHTLYDGRSSEIKTLKFRFELSYLWRIVIHEYHRQIQALLFGLYQYFET